MLYLNIPKSLKHYQYLILNIMKDETIGSYYTPPSSFNENRKTLPLAPLNINNSFKVYLFFDSELKNGGMKVQFKKDFKSYFFITKKKQ